MESLPGEILHNIFILVPFRDRLRCMYICRYWCNTLRKRSLLHNVQIMHENGLNNFIDMLQRMPRRGFQVEILEIEMLNTFDKRKLCNMLPNLRVFHYNDKAYHSTRGSRFNEPFEPLYTNSKMEVIEDEANCELTRQLLMSDSCHRLRSLSLKLNLINNPREELFIHFKNTPALKELSLYCFNIGIEDCEIIHKNTPALQTLSISHITLIPGELPRHIIPTTSVKTFRIYIRSVKNYPDYPEWYTYMAMKYTSLTSFIWEERGIESLDTDKTMRIYQDGILPLYKNIGSRLDYFYAKNIPTELNTFNTLDAFGLQLPNIYLKYNQDRPIFEQLAESNQSRFVKSIQIENTAIASPIMFSNFTSLTQIAIDQDGFSTQLNVNLTDYLNAFPPTLTSFTACFLDAEINELPSRQNNIRRLFLSCSKLYPKLAEAISNYFPQLSHLTLEGVVEEDLCINLPTHHLEKLDLLAYYDGGRLPGFSVTSEKSRLKYYIPDPDPDSHPDFSYPLRSATAKMFQNYTNIYIKYGTATARYFFIKHVEHR